MPHGLVKSLRSAALLHSGFSSPLWMVAPAFARYSKYCARLMHLAPPRLSGA
uniref:Uncharacterized protein n=1 Tax=Brassica oleracea TaxID=3712 RepID=A0A3P6DG39_BRAOL|nr:unnamed protein product [Brassica oleracea]